jgi:hypothetical protein
MPRHIPRSRALIVGSLLIPFTTSSAWDISEDRREITPKALPVRPIGVVIKGVIALSMAMLWILLSAGTGYGQQSSAAVTGLVKDTSGAIISGTHVKIRNVETNTFRETVSKCRRGAPPWSSLRRDSRWKSLRTRIERQPDAFAGCGAQGR